MELFRVLKNTKKREVVAEGFATKLEAKKVRNEIAGDKFDPAKPSHIVSRGADHYLGLAVPTIKKRFS